MALSLANRPFGFVPAYPTNGQEPRPRRYQLSTAYATNLFGGGQGGNGLLSGGDMVKTDTANRQEMVVRANATDTPVGVVKEFFYYDVNGKPIWTNKWIASTVTLSGKPIYVWVWDDPRMSFWVMCTAIQGSADIGTFTNLNNGTAGNTTTGCSGQYCDEPGSGAVLRLVRVPEITILDSNNNLAQQTQGGTTSSISYLVGEVEFVKHERLGTAAQVST